MTLFATAGNTDLEAMAAAYDWSCWFWRYPRDGGDAFNLLADIELAPVSTGHPA